MMNNQVYHRWECVMIYSPDFQVIGEIFTNGLYYVSVVFFDHRTRIHTNFSEACEKVMKGMFVN